jgi:copper chaperone CopZ
MVQKILLTIIAMGILRIATAQQINNAQQVTVRIDGDCPMCEKRIENVGSVPEEALVDWDWEEKTAVITYDSTRTDLVAILQRIAAEGYDTEQMLATDEAYEALPSCCQYDRRLKREGE